MNFLRMHLSFTEARRRRLAKKVDRLDRLESRTTITEPISFTGMAISAISGMVHFGFMYPDVGNALRSLARTKEAAKLAGQASPKPYVIPANLLKSIDGLAMGQFVGGGSAATAARAGSTAGHASNNSSTDWLSFNSSATSNASDTHGISAAWHPAKGPGGGAAQAHRGGTSAARGMTPTARGAITPLRLPANAASASTGGGASAPLLAAVAGASSAGGQTASAGTGGEGRAVSAPRISLVHAGSEASSGQNGGGITLSADGSPGQTSSGGAAPPGSTPDPVIGNSSGVTTDVTEPFNVYVLDNQAGVILYPGVQQLATLNGWMDLVAQVSGATASSYSWNTTGLQASSISGTSTDQLTFRWESSNEADQGVPATITLSVTDSSSQTLTYTYEFLIPATGIVASGSGGGTAATWPTSAAPSQELLSAPAFPSDNASVDATSGSLDTEIALPSYNRTVPALSLAYDSLAARPEPIITVENTLTSATVPSQVSAQLTFNGGTPLTTYYYNTSSGGSTLNPGDVQQINLQATNATSLATGRYTYSAQVVDIGTTVPTLTYSGGTNVLNYGSNAFGAGWTLEGLEHIYSESGGVILDLGDDGRTLWFTTSGSGGGSGGTTYVDPPGEFSTLVKNSGGSYTDTLTDGTQITFNSGGFETATIDLNGNHTTYSYSSGGNLTSIEDYLENTTTFAYNSGGSLQSIEDPALRFATFTQSGGDLTQAELPDGSTFGYSYSSGGQLTKITDPRSNSVTISYDSASRVTSVSLPESATEDFTNDQEAGWTNSGTSGSPAPATLLAQAGGTYTSPNGNLTTIQPDWMGLGQAGNIIDPLGNVQLFDRNSNGLATIAVDQVNRNTQYNHDSKGNVTSIVYEDGNSESYTFNSDSQPLTFTNADGNTTSFTYSGGNLVGIEDPLLKLTTMTYTATGQVQTTENADDFTTTNLYDSQDRLTTVEFPDGTTNLYSYNSQGNATKFVDNAGNATTYSFDAMNRETGSTNALNDVTTLTYDSGGNLIKDQEPTPSGQTARTTTYAYDSMDRLTTVTDPLGLQTISGYDADGNQVTAKDPMGRITTTVFDALDRPTVVIDPLNGNRTTTTYDGDSEVIQVVDPMGRITTTTYDNRGWVATSTDSLGNTSTYSYTADGEESTQSYPGSGGGTLVSYVYDKDDREISVTDANGDTTSFTYDGVGNQIAVTDANNYTTSYSYDSMNRVTTVTDALGHTTVYGYSGGNQITVTDGLGHTTTTQYDALNRATTITSPVSGGTTVIAYDAAGREISLTDPDNNKTQWAYDADDRVTTETLPNSATVTYVYDNDGELTDTTDADGRRTTYSYDADGDQTGETWVGASPSEKITYTYDADDELTGAADSYATLTFTYDSGGNNITSATSGPGAGQPTVTLTSGYDALHSLTSVTDNISGNVGIATFVYDASERLTTITTSYAGTAGPEVITSYAKNDQISAQSRTIGGSGTAVNTSYSYDAADRQTTITDYVSGGSALATYVYSYDNANRVTTMVDSDGTYTYTYDNGNELTNVDKGGTQVESYTYDSNGNRTGTGYSTTVMNETLTSPGVTYTYDAAGNMISANSGGTVTTYTYDYHNRLTEVTQGGTVIATYTYNALDQRIGIQEGGSRTWTVYNGAGADALPYADLNGSGTLLTRYVSGPGMVNGAVVDELLARSSSGGTTAWYLTDKLDSVRDVVSSAGSVLDHVVYDSFGNILTETSASNGDRFKFAGTEFDQTTHQYFDHARNYSSVAGRFTGVDPTGFGAGDADLYRYVGNDSTDGTDPTGRAWGFPSLGMPSLGDYWHYLTNTSAMDADLQGAQRGAVVVAFAAGGIVASSAVVAVTAVEAGLSIPSAMCIANTAALIGTVSAYAGGFNAYLNGMDPGQAAIDAGQNATMLAGMTLMARAGILQMFGSGPGAGNITCFLAGTPVLTGEPVGVEVSDDADGITENAAASGSAFAAFVIFAAALIPIAFRRMRVAQGLETRGGIERADDPRAHCDGDESNRWASNRGASARRPQVRRSAGPEMEGAARIAGAVSGCDPDDPRVQGGASRTGLVRRITGMAACVLFATLLACLNRSNWVDVRETTGRETHFVSSATPIEEVRVGQRVLASTVQTAGNWPPATHVDDATWRRLRLRAENPWADGTPDVIEVVTLQPPGWIESNRAYPGSFVPLPLELEEMGLRPGTMARVIASEPCPALEQGPGRVVLSTVNHLSDNVCKLVVAGADGRTHTVYPTGFHKFYSATCNRWISAEDLRPGEQLNGITGAVVVCAIARVPGIHRVYNMTVETEHEYRVSMLGVLVHNNGCAPTDPAQAPPVNGSTPANRLGNQLHHDQMNGGKGAGLPTQLQNQYPNTVFQFSNRFERAPDVTVMGGDHPSTYPNSTWPPGSNTGDFKPQTPPGLYRFNRELNSGKLPPGTTMLPYNPKTGSAAGNPPIAAPEA
jgi:RHS repeat-associated protein